MDFFQKACRALGDGTRLTIMKMLLGRSYCVNALAERLDISQSAVSQHLRVLREAGLVESEKEGFYVHYSYSPRGLEAFRREVQEVLDPGRHTGGCCRSERDT